MRGLSLSVFIVAAIFCLTDCRKVYNPPAIEADNRILTIDGVINTGSDNSSTIRITRSVNITDTVPGIPELYANAQIISSAGAVYPLIDSAGNGSYTSALLNLDPALKYQISVTTNNGSKYQSDFVTPKMGPPIDSITWERVFDPVINNEVINIYLYSHDPANNTRYYRWDYIETWIHGSLYQTHWTLKDGMEVPVDDDHTTDTCYTTIHSSNILLGSSDALGADVISKMLITTIIKDDPKMDIKYSIQVRQFPLDAESYTFWSSVQKNSQSLGGFFDLQPGQVNGNIHSVTHPDEPVVGYVSASSFQDQRIFISNRNLPGWKSNPLLPCAPSTVPENPINPLIWDSNYYGDYQLYYYSGTSMVIVPKICLDCRVTGGDTTRPSFWP